MNHSRQAIFVHFSMTQLPGTSILESVLKEKESFNQNLHYIFQLGLNISTIFFKNRHINISQKYIAIIFLRLLDRRC